MNHLKFIATFLLFGGLWNLDGFSQTTTPTVQTTQIAQTAQRTELLNQAERCRELLRGSILNFYSPASKDVKHLGYFEALNEDGRFAASDEKFLTFQARQTWFFSNMAVNKIDRQVSLSMAEHGYKVLQTRFLDRKNGGYFLKIRNDDGLTGEQSVVDNRKHVYPLSFVIYALVELHRATGSEEALQQAISVFDLLEAHCYDKKNGGYYELYTQDWKKITDTDQWGVVGTVGFKTYNSHLHLLEAFTPLYLETKNELVGKRLDELVEICVDRIHHPEHPCNIDAWTVDWKIVETEKNLRASFGHDLECAWLVLAAAEALGKRNEELEAWALQLCDHAISFGHDTKNGGFFYSGPLGKPSDDRKKEWWTQSEALVGLLTCYEISGDQTYLKLFNETLDFIEAHHVADQGGWYASLNEDGSLGKNKSRSSMWQGAYHNGRALMMCETLLRELASERK